MNQYCLNCMEKIGENDVCPYCKEKNGIEVIPHQLKPGTILREKYLIGKAIGQGGFGITYIARDLQLDFKVAIKEYFPNGFANRNVSVSTEITISDKNQEKYIEEGKEKFLNEAKAIAKFDKESGIVDVKEFFECNKTAYIVMEYLEGQDLRTYLKNNKFRPEDIFERMKPIIDSLKKIHEQGIIHRDISPDNIMILTDGTLKLMDFGAARVIDYDDPKSVSVILKAGYAPEEQYRPKGEQGPWTDIYSLCATIYKCITGKTLEDSLERNYALKTGKDIVEWPSDMGIEIPEKYERIIKKGLDVNWKKRYQTIQELEEDLYGKDDTGGSIVIDNELNDDREDVDDDRTIYYQHKTVSDDDISDGEGDVDEKIKPDDGEEKKGNKKKNKVIFGILGTCVMGLLVVVVIFGVFHGKDKTVVGTSGKNDVNTIQKDEFVYDPETMYRITLTAPNEMSVKQFNEAVDIVKNRLEIFAGKGNYNLDKEGDQLHLCISKKSFNDKDIKYVLKCYISSSMKLYLYNNKEKGNWYETSDNIFIARSDIEDIKIKEGSIEGIDPHEHDILTNKYQYIEMKLTDDFVTKHEKEISKWKGDVVLAQDIDSVDGWFYMPLHMSNDKKTLEILIDDLDGNYLEVVKYNWMNSVLADNLLIDVDIDNIVKWDKIDENMKTQSNQCNAQDFSEKTITILYGFSTDENISEGQWLDIKNVFRERLDCLEQPYSFGMYNENENQYFAIKTTLNHLGIPIMSIIGTNSIDLQAQLAKRSISTIPTKAEVGTENGVYVFTIQSEDEYGLQKDIKELSKLIVKNGAGNISLSVGGIPLVLGNVDKVIKDGKVQFTKVFSSQEEMNESNLWLVNIIEKTLNTEMPIYFSETTYAFNIDNQWDKGDFGYNFDDMFANSEKDIGKISEKISLIRSEISSDGCTAKILLNLNVDETLPQEFIDTVKKIYENFDFENSIYTDIEFYLEDEKYEDGERGRIFFDKSFSSYSSDDQDIDDGYIYAHGIFQGGRLNRYRVEFEDLVTSDEFIQKFTADDVFSSWQFGYTNEDADAKDVNLYVGTSKKKRFHITAPIGERTPLISSDVKNHKVKKYNFSSYSNIYDVEDKGDGKCVLYLKEEGTSDLILYVYTEDYLTLKEVMSVSAYKPVKKYTSKVKEDVSIYHTAVEETETENSDICGHLKKGSEVTVLGTCQKFYYIRDKNKVTGFISKNMIK